MAKTETDVSTLKINRGTYAKIQENLSSIGENELIITEDKNVPVPSANDAGKAVVVNASGDYELGSAGTNVVANPTLAGTESTLTGLQVGSTKYKVPEGYEVHTYTANKTYTSADTDYEQLRDDVTNGRMIRIGYYDFVVGYKTSSAVSYFSSSITMGVITIFGIYIDISSSSIVIGNVTSGVEVHQVTAQSQFSGTNLTAMAIDANIYNFVAKETRYLTTAPTADNTSGYLQTVVLTSEPATYYNGYYYIIAPTPTP